MDLVDYLRPKTPGTAQDQQVLKGILVRQGGKDYAKIDNSTALWGPISGAESLDPGLNIVLVIDQQNQLYVVYPSTGSGGPGGDDWVHAFEQTEAPDINSIPAPGEIGDIWIDTDAVPPVGPSGDLNYVHAQGSPSATWVVVHNLGKYVAVDVVDTGNSVVIPTVHYDSANQVTLTFGSPTSGKAYVN